MRKDDFFQAGVFFKISICAKSEKRKSKDLDLWKCSFLQLLLILRMRILRRNQRSFQACVTKSRDGFALAC